MLGIALELEVQLVFNNSMYKFGGQVYYQRVGGPTGNRLTMALSRILMIRWMREVTRILKE